MKWSDFQIRPRPDGQGAAGVGVCILWPFTGWAAQAAATIPMVWLWFCGTCTGLVLDFLPAAWFAGARLCGWPTVARGMARMTVGGWSGFGRNCPQV